MYSAYEDEDELADNMMAYSRSFFLRDHIYEDELEIPPVYH